VTAVQSSFQWVKLAAPALIIGSVGLKKEQVGGGEERRGTKSAQLIA